MGKLQEYKRKRKFGGKGTPEPPPPAEAEESASRATAARAATKKKTPPGRPKAAKGKQKQARRSAPARHRLAEGGVKPPHSIENRYVVQKHSARRMHYDFRLEMDGVLKSWAVPKGPSLNPADKRLAVLVEDHPVDYQHFEGIIPAGHYGAGPVMVWDRGLYELVGELDGAQQIARGEVKFTLTGEKLRGSYALVKLKHSEKGNEWLMIKHKDAADPQWNIDEHDGSVLTGRTLEEISEEVPPKRAPFAIRPEELRGAQKAALPAKIEPMLATIVERPFSDPAWLYEIKWDGVRALAWAKDGKLELRSRAGRTITRQYPEVSALPEHLRARQAVLDGEIVALDERGRGDFEKLQERMHNSSPSAAVVAKAPVTYYLFDLLYCDGYDLRDAPLAGRKALLRLLLRPDDRIRYCDHQAEHGKELFELAREHGLEGIVAKRAESVYSSGRSPSWAKLKTRVELDAVVVGWTEPRGTREHFGALLLGLYEGDTLEFAGHVGSGFDQKALKRILDQLRPLAAPKCPCATVPETNEKAYWAKPKLVARIQHSGWTQERRPRHPVFLGLRDDVKPADCQFATEAPAAAAAPSVVTAPAVVGRVLAKKAQIEAELFKGRSDNVTVELDGKRVRLANLNKVYFPEAGYTKRDLLAYYYRIADRLLPFLRNRAMVLRRYPDGIKGMSFFQKDSGDVMPDWMETVTIPSESSKRDEIRFLLCNDVAALLHLTNLGCIDHNPWSSACDDLEHPDYFFFDLDPSDGTEFSTVVTIARALNEKLEELGVRVFLKTSGATGIHMFIPVERGYTYEQLRMFAEIVARLVATEYPKLVTQERSVAKRPKGRVLIDVSQNAYGRPLAAVYVVRPFAVAPISAPLLPRELQPKLRPEHLNLKTIFRRLDKLGDLWADFWKTCQRLEEPTRRLSSRVPATKKR